MFPSQTNKALSLSLPRLECCAEEDWFQLSLERVEAVLWKRTGTASASCFTHNQQETKKKQNEPMPLLLMLSRRESRLQLCHTVDCHCCILHNKKKILNLRNSRKIHVKARQGTSSWWSSILQTLVSKALPGRAVEVEARFTCSIHLLILYCLPSNFYVTHLLSVLSFSSLKFEQLLSNSISIWSMVNAWWLPDDFNIHVDAAEDSSLWFNLAVSFCTTCLWLRLLALSFYSGTLVLY